MTNDGAAARARAWLAGSSDACGQPRGRGLGAPLTWVAETGSTSDDAKAGAKEGAPHGATWVADAQTAGRGRQGRTWLAQPGDALLFSVLLRLECPAARLPLLALAAGLAVRDGIVTVAPELEADTSRRPLIKWPNDILIGGKKVSGILAESSASSSAAALVVGIGVNVSTETFPDELTPRATSLSAAAGRSFDRAALLVAILERLAVVAPLVAAKGLTPVIERLRSFDALFGCDIVSELGTGRASGIDSDGRLLVTRADGARQAWAAGEVHLRTFLP